MCLSQLCLFREQYAGTNNIQQQQAPNSGAASDETIVVESSPEGVGPSGTAPDLPPGPPVLPPELPATSQEALDPQPAIPAHNVADSTEEGGLH